VHERRDEKSVGLPVVVLTLKVMLLHGAERCRSVHNVDDQRFAAVTMKGSTICKLIYHNKQYAQRMHPLIKSHSVFRLRIYGAKTGTIKNTKNTPLQNTTHSRSRTKAVVICVRLDKVEASDRECAGHQAHLLDCML
jgi:hypothetical protein